jgi:hypothetical protein
MNRVRYAAIVALLAALLGGRTALADDSGIQIDKAWARATPGAAKTGAIYLSVSNTGNAPDRLTAISTPAADKAELHEMKIENGIMEMRPVSALPIAPGQSLVLEPSGYHIMLTGLKAPLKEGGKVQLTLTFEHAGSVPVTATIAKIGAMHAGEMSAMPGMSMAPAAMH